MVRNRKGSAEEQYAVEEDVVRLKCLFPSPQEVFYFYEGELPVVDGVIAIPVDKQHWVQRAYLKGFQCDPETGDIIPFGEILAMLSAMSAGDAQDAGTDVGGQPTSDDGVRTGSEAGA